MYQAIVFLPLGGFLIAGLFGRFIGPRPSELATTATFLSGTSDVLQAGGGGPVRSITRRADGRLIGPLTTGHSIEVWTSGDDGASWVRSGSVASNSAVDFGDPALRAKNRKFGKV